MNWSFEVGSLCAGIALVAGCAPTRPAPVVDRTSQPQSGAPAKPVAAAKPAPRPGPFDSRPEFYTVRRSDTLYSIALDHGIDYRELAQWNGIDNPAAIQVGQQLRLTAPAVGVTTAPLKTAPGVEARPLGTVPLPPSGVPSAVKSEPKALRLPYSDQAYAQLAAIKPDGGPPPPQLKPEGPPAQALPDGEEPQFMWPVNGKLVASFQDSGKGIGIAGRSGQ